MRKGEETMKKDLRRITALLLLIGLGILLISCASQKPTTQEPEVIPPSAESDSEPSVPEDEPEEEMIPENQTVIYRAIAEEWSQYLTYKAPTVRTPLTASSVYTAKQEEQILSSPGIFILTREKTWDAEKKVNAYTLRVYNKTNGKQVIPALTYTDDPKSVCYDVNLYDTVISVGTDTPVLDDKGQVKDYVRTYDAYSADGIKLNEAAASAPLVHQVCLPV